MVTTAIEGRSQGIDVSQKHNLLGLCNTSYSIHALCKSGLGHIQVIHLFFTMFLRPCTESICVDRDINKLLQDLFTIFVVFVLFLKCNKNFQSFILCTTWRC